MRISPNRGENKTYLKPSPREGCNLRFKKNSFWNDEKITTIKIQTSGAWKKNPRDIPQTVKKFMVMNPVEKSQSVKKKTLFVFPNKSYSTET